MIIVSSKFIYRFYSVRNTGIGLGRHIVENKIMLQKKEKLENKEKK